MTFLPSNAGEIVYPTPFFLFVQSGVALYDQELFFFETKKGGPRQVFFSFTHSHSSTQRRARGRTRARGRMLGKKCVVLRNKRERRCKIHDWIFSFFPFSLLAKVIFLQKKGE